MSIKQNMRLKTINSFLNMEMMTSFSISAIIITKTVITWQRKKQKILQT